MLDARLFILQRATALLLAPLVIGHVVMIIAAVQDGLSAAEILGRTRGSLFWGLYYGAFVLAAAIHGAIGLRVVAAELLPLRGAALMVLTWAAFLLLALAGARAVWAVVGGG